MKNLFSKFTAIVLAIASSAFFIGSCTVDDLTKDLTIYTGNGFLTNPISIQVSDAAKQEAAPADLTVTIEGRDKAKIFTIFGESKIKAVSGVIALAVKLADAPTIASPLQFTLILTAPNYVTVRKNYSVTASNDISADKVAMVNLLALPTGVSVQNTSFTTTATGTAADVAFASPLSGGKVEQASVTVKAGTKALAADGTALTGAIETQLVHYDIRSEASLNGMPEGFANISLKTGTTTAQTGINPAGFYSMNMTSGGKEVSSFSTPLDVTMDVDPNYYNEDKERLVQAGDVLNVISRKETEATWNAETTATVVSVGGKLKATFKQAHLSVWALYIPNLINICVTQNELKILSDIPAIAANKATDCTARETFTYKLVKANNTNLVIKGGQSNLANNQILTDAFIVTNPNTLAKLQVYNAASQLLYTTPAQAICGTNKTFDLRGKLPANKSIVAKLDVSAACISANNITTILIPSNVSLWYRNMASPANASGGGWAPLVTIADGKACAKGMVAGESYDFAMPVTLAGSAIPIFQTFSKELRQPNGLKIPVTGDLVIDVISATYNVKTTLVIRKLADGTYDLTYNKYPLPTNICTELDKKFSVFLTRK